MWAQVDFLKCSTKGIKIASEIKYGGRYNITGVLIQTWVQVELFTLIDENDKNCIGYRNGQVNIKHIGCFEIDAGSNRSFYANRREG